MSQDPKSFSKRYIKKAVDAFKGLGTVIHEESSLVFIFGIIFVAFLLGGINHARMSYLDWIIVVLASGLLVVIEIINTAFENVVDLINFKYSLNAKKIKNIAAAASLVINLAVIVGLIILFVKKFS